MAKGIRVNQLAKEIGIDSKQILDKLQNEGLGEKAPNHMSVLPLGLAESVRDWFSSGNRKATFASPVVSVPVGPGISNTSPAPHRVAPTVNTNQKLKPPRVFFSYTHESTPHKRWVLDLATKLRGFGVDVVLDQWDLRLGDDLLAFMEREIREADRVLLVCTDKYGEKSNQRNGGVGYESLVVSAEIARDMQTKRFVCVLRSGTADVAIPSFARSRHYIDFRDESCFSERLDELVRDIHEYPANPKPPLGPHPFRPSSPFA